MDTDMHTAMDTDMDIDVCIDVDMGGNTIRLWPRFGLGFKLGFDS